MRWFTYFILAYVFIGLQSGLSGYVHYRGAAPNLVLIAAVFIALNAPREPAVLGCFLMGLMQDMLAQHPLGLYALGFGVVGLVVHSLQTLVYREHPLTHFAMTLIAGVLVTALVLVHGLVHPPRLPSGPLLLGAVYTALLAPVVIFILQKLRRIFGFDTPRRKLRAWS